LRTRAGARVRGLAEGEHGSRFSANSEHRATRSGWRTERFEASFGTSLWPRFHHGENLTAYRQSYSSYSSTYAWRYASRNHRSLSAWRTASVNRLEVPLSPCCQSCPS